MRYSIKNQARFTKGAYQCEVCGEITYVDDITDTLSPCSVCFSNTYHNLTKADNYIVVLTKHEELFFPNKNMLIKKVNSAYSL